MLFWHWNSSLDPHTLVWVYLFFYNVTMLFFLWILSARIIGDLRTLHTLSTLNFDPFNTFVVTILLLSMAGVPPFTGFFTKVLLLLVLSTSKIYLMYPLLIANLLSALYFYLQNLRYLHQSNRNLESLVRSIHPSELNLTLFTLVFTLVTMFGVFFLDDIITISIWLLN